jgi:Domain of unknown function (DUF4190)
MTTPPGDGTPQDPQQPEQPGYWEQQQAQQGWGQPHPTQAYQQPYQQQYQQPYPPQGYPVAYAPEHPKATTALVLGILGVVLCQVLAPFAWRIGKRTRDEIDASQGRLAGRGSAQAGYILGIVGTVLLGFVVLYLVFVVGLVVVGGLSSSGSF